MKSYEDAIKLTIEIVNIGIQLNKNIKAEIIGINQPLGKVLGNILKIEEIIEILKGNGLKEFEEICPSF